MSRKTGRVRRHRCAIEALESRTLLANDTIATAINLGAVGTSGSVSKSGTQGTTVPSIFYKFSINSIRDVTLSMTMSSGDASLQFIRDGNNNGIVDSGDVLEDHFTGSTVAEHQRLPAGTYFAHVYNPTASAAFTVTVKAPTAPGDPGNSLAAVKSLGAVGTSGSITNSDWVGSGDAEDNYSFSISSIRDVTVSMTMTSGDASLQFIRDANSNHIIDSGDVLEDHFTGSTVSEHQRLPAGTYFARVYNPTEDAFYSVTVVAPSSAADPGNALKAAKSLGAVGTSGSITNSDWVGSGDAEDNYSFTISSIRDMTVTLTMSSGDASLQFVRDANNNGIVDSGDVLEDHFTGSTATEHQRLPAGTYFARVYNPTEDAFYSVTVVAPSAPADPGNTLGTAKALGAVNGNIPASDWVGSADSEDDYSFTVASRRSVTVSMQMTSGDADLQLIKDVNGNKQIDSGDVIEDHFTGSVATIQQTLAAGTYYVRVSNPTEDAFYSLAVTSPVVQTTTVGIAATDASAAFTGTNTGTFTITRSGSTTAALTVGYTITGTAVNGTDYNTIAASVTIPAGKSSATVTITPKDGTKPTKTVILTLKTSSGYAINASQKNATVTITGTQPTVSLTALDPDASETPIAPTSTGLFAITRTGSTTAALTLTLTLSGTATYAQDFTFTVNGASSSSFNATTKKLTLTIPAGKSAVTILVAPINDTVKESTETVIFTLATGTGFTIASGHNTATVDIADWSA
jgi:hypothetical protein